MAKYNHGVGTNELATKTKEPQITLSGIPVVVGTAPINLAKNPKVNVPVYAEKLEDATDAFGYSEDFAQFTLCQSMFMHFVKFQVAPVILINVLDPKKHKKELAEMDCQVKDGQATIEVQGVILQDLLVKNGETELVADTDYIATFDDDNNVLITLVNAAGVTEVKVSGNVIDPSKVTSQDIIGAYNEDTGEETGLELVKRVFPKYQVFSGSLLAPGYSKDKNVAAMLQSKAKDINGMFNCMALVDIEADTTTKYTDVPAAKSNIGVSGENTILLWPMLKYGESIVSYSASMAAVMQKLDSTNGGVPAQSPSNQTLGCDGICTATGEEILLDEPEANTLNAIGVVTSTNFDGWRAWGNNTACYPENKDPKDRWINCKRYFYWRENNFIVNVHKQVDGIPTPGQIKGIVDNENIKGNSYANEGFCAGDKIEFNIKENPTADILNGHFKFHFALAPYSPAEYVYSDFEYDAAAIENAYQTAFGQ